MSETQITSSGNKGKMKSPLQENLQVPLKGYIFLILGILMFSGLFQHSENILGILDYSVLLGQFGKIAEGSAAGFRGSGGIGAREGFVFAFTALPAVGLAIGLIAVIEGQRGLDAAQKLLSPLLRPLMGIPGWCGLALIGSLQNTDTGSAMTGQLYTDGLIDEEELAVFSAFLFSGSAIIAMHFGTAILLFTFMEEAVSPIIPFLVMIVGKVFGANLMRLYLKFKKRRRTPSGSK